MLTTALWQLLAPFCPYGALLLLPLGSRGQQKEKVQQELRGHSVIACQKQVTCCLLSLLNFSLGTFEKIILCCVGGHLCYWIEFLTHFRDRTDV